MPCVKWENAKLTGFKVFRWNELLTRNNIPEEEGIIVFRRHDRRVKRIYKFNIFNLVRQTPDPTTGHFLPRQDCPAFTRTFTKSNLFWIRQGFRVVSEIHNFIQSFLEFSGFTVNCPHSPRLVFVVDLSYDPVLFPDCWAPQYDDVICMQTHAAIHMQGEPIEDEDEDGVLEVYADPDVSEDEDGGEVEDDVGVDDDDVEGGYSEEVKELVRELRAYRSVGRTYPMVPLYRGEPMGLVQVEGAPFVERLSETVSFDCPVCRFAMEVGEPVLKTKCGCLLHKVCWVNWFSPDVKCPVCRSCTATRV